MCVCVCYDYYVPAADVAVMDDGITVAHDAGLVGDDHTREYDDCHAAQPPLVIAY